MGQVIPLRTRPAVPGDAVSFAAYMRAADYAEYAAIGEPAALLAAGIRSSVWSYLAEDDGGPVCLFGLERRTLLGGEGHAWCATTYRVTLHKRAFALASRAWADAMRAECDVLSGWVLASYDVSMRWLVWMGFELGPAMPLPPLGVMFRPFWWRR